MLSELKRAIYEVPVRCVAVERGGHSALHAARLCYRTEGDALILPPSTARAPPGWIAARGTLLEIRITSPMPDVIRVQARHHHPNEPGVRGFDLDYGLKAAGVRIEERDEHLIFTTSRLSLRIARARRLEHAIRRRCGGSLVTGGAGKASR